MAYVGGAVSILLFLILIPGVMMALRELTESQFRGWVMALQLWCFFMAIVVIIVAPVEEITTIIRQLRANAHQRQATGNGEAGGETGETQQLQQQQQRNSVDVDGKVWSSSTPIQDGPDSLLTKL